MKRVLIVTLRSSPRSGLGHVHLSEQLFWAGFVLSLYLGSLTIWTWGIHFSKITPTMWLSVPWLLWSSFLAKTPTCQDLYKQQECPCKHSWMDLSGRKNFCNRSAFYPAAFQAGRHYNRQCTFWEGLCIFRDSCKWWNNNKNERSEVELSDKNIW